METKKDAESGQHHFDRAKIKEWTDICCSECDAVVAYFPPEIKFHGDELPLYCFLCAVNLNGTN